MITESITVVKYSEYVSLTSIRVRPRRGGSWGRDRCQVVLGGYNWDPRPEVVLWESIVGLVVFHRGDDWYIWPEIMPGKTKRCRNTTIEKRTDEKYGMNDVHGNACGEEVERRMHHDCNYGDNCAMITIPS